MAMVLVCRRYVFERHMERAYSRSLEDRRSSSEQRRFRKHGTNSMVETIFETCYYEYGRNDFGNMLLIVW